MRYFGRQPENRPQRHNARQEGRARPHGGRGRHEGQQNRQEQAPYRQTNPRRQADYSKIDLKALSRKAMRQHGFDVDFPPQVMREVDSLGEAIPPHALKGARDLRHLLWSSIDNSDSEDLDQLEYCERGRNGEIRALVAIADVDSFIPKGSQADKFAASNTTSVYTGVEIYPMLPDKLSKNLSSLLPGKDRLAVVIEFFVLPSGIVRPGQIFRALVRNRAKLVYEEIGEWLDHDGPLPEPLRTIPHLREQVLLQNEASKKLGGYRHERGALELDTREARAVVRDNKVEDVVAIEVNSARHIIENFMVAANGVMSAVLEKARMPIIQRVVRIPKDWEGIVALAAAHRWRLPREPNPKALAQFLEAQKRQDPLRFPDLSLAVVKLLGSGEYVLFDRFKPHLGHFSLAVADYTHSTAPNRRYPDVINQRMLFASLNHRPPPYKNNEIERIAFRCTQMEKESKKIERFMRKAASAVLLSGKVGETFDAIVTGASAKGIYVRLLSPPAEGRVIRNFRGMRIGQQVKVRLANLNPYLGFIDFDGAYSFSPQKRPHHTPGKSR